VALSKISALAGKLLRRVLVALCALVWTPAPSSSAEDQAFSNAQARPEKPTLWAQQKSVIVTILAVLLLQSFLLVKLYAEARTRRVAQRLSEENKERMDAAIAGADLGLWQWTANTDNVWATERCRALLGLDKIEDLSRDAFLECLRPADRSLALERISVAMRTGDICVAEYLIAMPNGDSRWILSKAIPKRGQNGIADHLVGVVLDITERKEREKEVERQRQELAHLSRVSVVGALSGALAHELAQPLTAILSNAQAASRMLDRDSGVDLDEIRNILADIMIDDKRAGDVIHHLRSLLRKDQATRDIIDANELVNSVLALCHSDLVIKNVAVVKKLNSRNSALVGDSVQLRQVLLNLIVNACDAMANKPASERLLIVTTEQGSNGSVKFAITDSGSGISSAAIEELFRPFYTTKSLGMGLGLPICHWIISAHGGRLAGQNNTSGGATFTFELPTPVEGNHVEQFASRVLG
jgi:C4-dicarboxylate-specific signal transduction histidine kinase